MLSEYALTPKLGTTRILKVCKTSMDIFNRTILNYYVNTNEMGKIYYLKDPSLMENDNGYEKYGPVRVCGYLQGEYGNLFENILLPDLSDIPILEVKTALAQGTYDKGDTPPADDRKCYECDGNDICHNFPQLKQANSSSHSGHGGHGSSSRFRGRVNGDRGGYLNGARINTNHNSRNGNHKPMVIWKYIHPVDENAVVKISGTTWKF